MKCTMKIPEFKRLAIIAAFALAAFAPTAKAQPTNYATFTFDTSDTVTPWFNWFGGAFSSVAWDGTVNLTNSTFATNATSGSMQVISTWNHSGDQLMLNSGWGTFNPAFNGLMVTNFEADVMFDPSSVTNASGTYGSVAFGSRGVDYGQYLFGSVTVTPAQAGQWVHVSFPINATLNAKLDTIPNVIIQQYDWSGTMSGQETFWVDNIVLQGTLTLPPAPPPTMNLIPATPGLRWFAQNSQQTYNEEGVATFDSGQSWVGATQPASYSVTFGDWNTVPGFIFQMQFIPNPAAVNPYTPWSGPNNFALTITKQATNFTASIDWKTNRPSSGTVSNAMFMSTTTTKLGTWTWTFSNNPDGSATGTVTAPDGSTGSFSVASDVAAIFANPCYVFYGIVPNSTQGEGQFIDVNRITTTNVSGANIDADFVANPDSFDTNSVWNTAYSLDQNSVQIVTTNTPYWLTWVYPDTGFASGLETATNLAGNWLSPAYYNNGTPVVSTLMGTKLKWTLLSKANLPTVDGMPGSMPSPNAFFHLIKRNFTKLQVLLPGETNAPGTVTGKVGTPTAISLGNGGAGNVTINAVDSTYHIVTVSGDMISLTSSDASATLPAAAALANGTVTEQVFFGSTGNFTVTATDTTTATIPAVTSSSVTVGP